MIPGELVLAGFLAIVTIFFLVVFRQPNRAHPQRKRNTIPGDLYNRLHHVGDNSYGNAILSDPETGYTFAVDSEGYGWHDEDTSDFVEGWDDIRRRLRRADRAADAYHPAPVVTRFPSNVDTVPTLDGWRGWQVS